MELHRRLEGDDSKYFHPKHQKKQAWIANSKLIIMHSSSPSSEIESTFGADNPQSFFRFLRVSDKDQSVSFLIIPGRKFQYQRQKIKKKTSISMPRNAGKKRVVFDREPTIDRLQQVIKSTVGSQWSNPYILADFQLVRHGGLWLLQWQFFECMKNHISWNN